MTFGYAAAKARTWQWSCRQPPVAGGGGNDGDDGSDRTPERRLGYELKRTISYCPRKLSPDPPRSQTYVARRGEVASVAWEGAELARPSTQFFGDDSEAVASLQDQALFWVFLRGNPCLQA